ncbi:MAG: HAD family phosphatase [bacterium]|nr:HAD family phosphatase [bacterium]
MNGVVFDFDGVLADSEPLSWQAWADVLAPYGVSIGDDDIVACTGTTSRDTHAHFNQRAELPPYQEVLAAVDEHRRNAYPTDLGGFGDAIEAVRALAMVGVPLAIASSSSRTNLDIKLRVLDLGRYFEFTVAGDEVENGKPAPDLYRTAVERLGIDAATSVAVEDTAIGADAAAAAGLRTVIVNRMNLPTGSHPVVSEVDADLLLLWLGRL